MRIVICGSMSQLAKMEAGALELRKKGHEVIVPEASEGERPYSEMSVGEIRELKKFYISRHLDHIRAADCILVANYDKGNQKGYIGANTFLEMGFAFVLRKPMYVLFALPKEQGNYEEMLGLGPIVLNGVYNLIT